MSLNWKSIENMWYFCIIEYYSSIKNKDILNFAGKWMEFENIILNEITKSQKDMHGMYSHINSEH